MAVARWFIRRARWKRVASKHGRPYKSSSSNCTESSSLSSLSSRCDEAEEKTRNQKAAESKGQQSKLDDPSTTTRDEDDSTKNDSLPHSLHLLALTLVLSLWIGRPIAFYLMAYKVLVFTHLTLSKWYSFFADDHLTKEALRYLKSFLRRVMKEGERALNGDYSRQVMAGYLIYNMTAPGESYVGACIRYRMSMINHRLIEEIEEWQLRRLGYKESSKRDIFS